MNRSAFSNFRFNERQAQQSEHSESLQQRANELKASLSSAQLEVSRWMAQHDSLIEQYQSLDLKMTKTENHCEVNRRNKWLLLVCYKTNGIYDGI